MKKKSKKRKVVGSFTINIEKDNFTYFYLDIARTQNSLWLAIYIFNHRIIAKVL